MSAQETATVDGSDVEVIDPETAVRTTDDVTSFQDVITAIEHADEEQLLLGDDVFQQVYEAAHDTDGVPDQRVQMGRIMTPVVRAAARNIEQELSVSVPVVLPNGESVKMYTTLYGSDKPDTAIDKMLHQYTAGDPKLSKLVGVSVPLIWLDGEWKLYLISTDSLLGMRAHAWFAENLRSLVSDSDIVPFGKTYESPFEDDPALINDGGTAALAAIEEEYRNR